MNRVKDQEKKISRTSIKIKNGTVEKVKHFLQLRTTLSDIIKLLDALSLFLSLTLLNRNQEESMSVRDLFIFFIRFDKH